MNSLKFKLTAIFCITLIVVILLFSHFTYMLTSELISTEIGVKEMQQLIRGNPNLREFLLENSDLENLAEINSLVREYEKIEIRNIIIQVTVPFVIASALIAYLVSLYFLRPIEELTRQISKINPKTLDRRIPSMNSSKEIEYLISSFNNLLASLEIAFSMRETFIQDVAHEIRTPLSAIKANIDVVKRKKHVTEQEYKDLFNTIEKLNNELISLNESILFLDTLENKYEEMRKVNLNYVVEDILESLQAKIKERKINVDFQTIKSPQATVNAKEFTIALRNIIENSIKYSKETGGEIKIRIKQSAGAYLIIIKDNGIGIKQKDLSRIFDRFYRGRNSSAVSGSGLGLSIVKKILEKHGGSIDITSVENKGTTTTLTLPLN